MLYQDATEHILFGQISADSNFVSYITMKKMVNVFDTKANQNIQNFKDNNNSSVTSVDLDEFDEQLEFSDLNKKRNIIEGTGSVFTNNNM